MDLRTGYGFADQLGICEPIGHLEPIMDLRTGYVFASRLWICESDAFASRAELVVAFDVGDEGVAQGAFATF